MSKEYSLKFLRVTPYMENDKVVPGVMQFNAPRPYILIDSVAVAYPCTSPYNSLALFVPRSPLLNIIDKIDLSDLESPAGSIRYNAISLKEGEVQYVVLLLKNI